MNQDLELKNRAGNDKSFAGDTDSNLEDQSML